MTYQIPKSRIADPEDFKKQVTAHCDELTAWAKHMAVVKRQEPLPPIPQWKDYASSLDPATAFSKDMQAFQEKKLQHFDPVPRPMAHEVIENSIHEEKTNDETSFVSDYEIIDDDPDNEILLRQKKDALLHQIIEAENATLARMELPPGKRRLANLQEAEIIAKENDEITKLVNRRGSVMSPKDFDDIQKSVISSRSKHDNDHIINQKKRRDQSATIVRRAAEIMSEIEDLTIENIDAYKLPEL